MSNFYSGFDERSAFDEKNTGLFFISSKLNVIEFRLTVSTVKSMQDLRNIHRTRTVINGDWNHEFSSFTSISLMDIPPVSYLLVNLQYAELVLIIELLFGGSF